MILHLSLRRFLTAAALLALFAGAAAFALSTGAPGTASADAVAKASISAVPTDQSAAFAALRQAPADAVPPLLRQFADNNSVQFAPNADLAREVTPAGAPGAWYLIPGNDSLCLYETADNAGTCATLTDAEAGRLYLQLVKPPTTVESALPAAGRPVESTTVGLAPDGAPVTARALGGALVKPTRTGSLFSVTGTDVAAISVGSTSTRLVTSG